MRTRPLTRKQALAGLSRLRKAYLDLLCEHDYAHFEAGKATLDESLEALLVLVDAIHGKGKPGEGFFLCDVCHLRRGDWPKGGHQDWSHVLWICAPCQAAHDAAHTQELARKRDGNGSSSDEIQGSKDMLNASPSYSNAGDAGAQEARRRP